ncbi:rolling circle replication-associated protein [Mycobacterium antarcticum]|uniref:rolling circle replication-associated protein n=1 Tax=Mycolicibacterium sp. TUM20985 TaxID=3023370 RepID=UPI0033657E10
MPSNASSTTGSTPSMQGSTSASQHPAVRQSSAGAAVDGRSRAPEAARPQGARATVVGRTSTGAPDLTPALDSGLVICAENVRDPASDGIATGDLRAIDALGLRFPSPEMVNAAAALFEPAAPWACGSERLGVEPESGRFRITIGPGVVRLGWTNPVRAEKTAERAVSHHQRDVDEAKFHVRNDIAVTDGDDDQTVVSLTRRSPTEDDQRGTGGVITEWSRKSRSAMCRTFAELDYIPLVESGRVPAMVTLTYPGEWEIVAPDGPSVKRHMVLWRKRFQREYGEPARYIWKLEFQRRGAPHIHLWMAPPTSPGRSGVSFAHWLSDTWAQVVDHPDPEQRARHRLAGTAIDVRNGLKACDPKRLAIYFTKHSSPNLDGDKEYQHVVPELWQRPGRGPGRFWGVYGLKKAIAVVEVAQDAYLTARRIVRRWSRSQAVYGDSGSRFPTAVVPRTAVLLVRRVHHDTGVVTYRKVRRRRTLCNQGGLAGGYALVNDGPGFAAQLARAIS